MDPDILNNLPPNLDKWTYLHLESFLERISLEDLVSVFHRKKYDGKKFNSVSEIEIQNLANSSIKAKKLINWRKFINEINETNEKYEDNSSKNEEEKETPSAPMIKLPNHAGNQLQNPIKIKLISKNDSKVPIPEEIKISYPKFTFKRSNSIPQDNEIFINDAQISSNQTEILYTGSFFLLGDKGSLNGTFLNIPSNKKLPLSIGMNLEMGNTDFKILDLKKNSIKISYKAQEEEAKTNKITLSFDKDEKFNIGKKKESNIYVKDDNMENEHAQLTYDGCQIYLEPQKNKFGVWLNLQESDESKRFYAVMEEGTIFRVCLDFHFKVTELKDVEIIPKCVTCNKKQSNSVFIPCQHMQNCYECSKKTEKCPMKNCKNDYPAKSFRTLQLIDK